MKISYLLIFLFTSIISIAQTDSTKLKLERYKELREQGLITDEEYDLLKKKELDLAKVEIIRPDTIDLDALKKKFRGQLIGGSIGVPTGVAFIVTAIRGFDYEKVTVNSSGKVIGISDKKGQAWTVLFGGIGFSAIGSALIIIGSRNRSKYFERISLSPGSVSIRF